MLKALEVEERVGVEKLWGARLPLLLPPWTSWVSPRHPPLIRSGRASFSRPWSARRRALAASEKRVRTGRLSVFPAGAGGVGSVDELVLVSRSRSRSDSVTGDPPLRRQMLLCQSARRCAKIRAKRSPSFAVRLVLDGASLGALSSRPASVARNPGPRHSRIHSESRRSQNGAIEQPSACGSSGPAPHSGQCVGSALAFAASFAFDSERDITGSSGGPGFRGIVFAA